MPKPPEKPAPKASSPCTPMHLVQDNWRKEIVLNNVEHMETHQHEQNVKPSDQAPTPLSNNTSNKRSTSSSSKTSKAASPLKISSATFYSNAPGKREHKGITCLH